MAPKKRKAESEEEDLEEEVSEGEPAAEPEDHDYSLGEEDDDKPKKKKPTPKKPRAPPKAKKTDGPWQDDDGWAFEPPSLLYKDYGTKPNAKIAGVDLDGTLVNVKGRSKFPKDADDWKWFNKKTAEKVKSYHQDGYKVVIFTNQGGIKKAVRGKAAENLRGRVDNVVKELGIPVQVFAATLEDDNRKPAKGMWDFMCKNCNGGVSPDLSSSFYVGDAAGRPGDFADSDKQFAGAVGIAFKTPEEEFGDMDGKKAAPGGGGGGAGPASGNNPELVDLFNRLADKYSDEKFKMISFKKVASVLGSFPQQVSLDNLKEVAKLQGVGKGSIAKIKEFLETGKCMDLDGYGDVGQAAPELKSKGAELADKFM